MSQAAAPARPIATLWANGPALLVVCMLLWAASVVVARAAAADIPPSLFTALRWGGALVIALPFSWRHLRADWPVLARSWRLVSALAFLGIGAYNNLVYHGLHSTTAINALLLQSATPLFVLIAIVLIYREAPSWRQVTAILISMAGVVTIATGGSLERLLTLRFNHGDVLVIVAVALYAGYSALLRMRPAVHQLSLLTACIAVGVVFMAPLAAVEFAHGARLDPTPLALFALVYSATLPSFFAYLLFNRGVELIGPARAGQYLHLMPGFGVLLAAGALGERLGWEHAAGIGLIAIGLWLAR